MAGPGLLPHGGLGLIVQVFWGLLLFWLLGLSFHVKPFIIFAHSCHISIYTYKTRVSTKTMKVVSDKTYLL
jgi:hypothetical protein